MKKTSNKGFTLVELIIVIAILAIIMLIAIPNFSGIQQRMQVRADKSSAAQIGKAVRIWYTEYTSDEAFKTAVGAGNLPKQDKDNAVAVKKIDTITKLDEYVDTSLVPQSLREADSTIIAENQYYYAGLVGSGTAEKIVVCISNATAPSMPKAGTEIAVNYTGVFAAETPEFNESVAYMEP